MHRIIDLVRSIPSKRRAALSLAMLVSSSFLFSDQKLSHKRSTSPPPTTAKQSAGDEISGMYSFLREGEFVQITVEDGALSGFVSRYGERDSDRDLFLDQFFSKASLEGKHISFTTKPVHGTWYEFSGEIVRGDVKSPDLEGYWVIRGTLKQFDQDESSHVTEKSREVRFKSFPQEPEEEKPK